MAVGCCAPRGREPAQLPVLGPLPVAGQVLQGGQQWAAGRLEVGPQGRRARVRRQAHEAQGRGRRGRAKHLLRAGRGAEGAEARQLRRLLHGLDPEAVVAADLDVAGRLGLRRSETMKSALDTSKLSLNSPDMGPNPCDPPSP